MKILPIIKKLPVGQPVILLVLTIGLVVVASLLFLKPMWGKYQSNKKAIAQEKGDVDKMNQKLTVLSQFDEDSLRRRYGEVQYALPDRKNVPGVIAGLTRLTQENNLSLDALQVRPGKLATESSQQEISMKVAVSGDLKNIDAFLQRVYQVRRILGIEKLSGTSSQLGGGFVTNLDISIFTLASLAQLGNYTEPLPEDLTQKFTFIDALAKSPVYTEITSTVPIITATGSGTQATGSAVRGVRTTHPSTPRPTITPRRSPITPLPIIPIR